MASDDPWHIGELPGDDGRTIRDQNGLTVGIALDRAQARLLVDAHNGEADDEPETCRTCDAPLDEAGDGYDGECANCADRSSADDFEDDLQNLEDRDRG